MRLVVFGSTGKTGRWLARHALEQGHDVTAIARESRRDAVPAGAGVRLGDVTDAGFVASAIDGHDAVCSCLGLRRATLLPWSRLLSPPDLVETFTHNLRRAVVGSAHSRIVWISAGGVGDSRAGASPVVRALIDTGNIGVAYRDLAAAEALVPEDDPRWLAVRPVTLMRGAPSGRAGVVGKYGLFSTVRRSDVAAWMLGVAAGSIECEHRAVLLGSCRG